MPDSCAQSRSSGASADRAAGAETAPGRVGVADRTTAAAGRLAVRSPAGGAASAGRVLSPRHAAGQRPTPISRQRPVSSFGQGPIGRCFQKLDKTGVAVGRGRQIAAEQLQRRHRRPLRSAPARVRTGSATARPPAPAAAAPKPSAASARAFAAEQRQRRPELDAASARGADSRRCSSALLERTLARESSRSADVMRQSLAALAEHRGEAKPEPGLEDLGGNRCWR